MPTGFEFKQGYALFQAEFPRPALDALHPSLQIVIEQLLSRLAPYGARFADFKLDQADGALGRANLSCPLMEFTANLRVFIERLELETFYLERVGLERFRSVAADAASALLMVRGGAPFATYTFDLGLHGIVNGVTPRDFLGRFRALRPQHRGELKGSGVILYFGPVDEQVGATVTADMSGPVSDGVFVRSRASWDASAMAPEALSDQAARELDAALAVFDLELSRQN